MVQNILSCLLLVVSTYFLGGVKAVCVSIVYVVFFGKNHWGLFVTLCPRKSDFLVLDVENEGVLSHEGGPEEYLSWSDIFVSCQTELLLVFLQVKVLWGIPVVKLILFHLKPYDWIAHEETFSVHDSIILKANQNLATIFEKEALTWAVVSLGMTNLGIVAEGVEVDNQRVPQIRGQVAKGSSRV